MLSTEGLQQFFIFLAGSGKNTEVVTVGIAKDLGHSGETHRACCSGEENGCFHWIFVVCDL